MGYFDYSREPQSDIAFVDKEISFYARWSVLNVGYTYLRLLYVMSRAENANGLILSLTHI